jgi:hypothetical protein
MDGRPYIIPSKGIDAPSLSKTNYGEKLGGKIKKGMTVLAKAHAGDVKERKAKAVAHAKAVQYLAVNEARGKEYPATHIGSRNYAVSQQAAKTVRSKLSSSAPAPHLQGRMAPQSSVRAGYKRTARRVQAPAGAPSTGGPTRQVQGSGNSLRSVQFRSL